MPVPDVSHVLFITDPDTGIWSYGLHLAAGMARNGVRTTFAVAHGELSNRQREAVAVIPHAKIAEGDPLAIAAQVKPDLVHLNHLASGAQEWGRPTVLTLHGERNFDQMARETFATAGMVLSPTAYELTTVERALGPARRAAIVPHGRDAGEYMVGGKKNMVFAMGSPSDDSAALAVMESVAPAVEWPVYWAGGNGERRPHVANLVPLGRVCPQAITAWYARAAIFALPSRHEPAAASALEAALCGCALVLADIPELRELWGEAAIFVEPGDIAAWSRTIQRLSGDADQRQAMSQAAIGRAKTYSAKAMVCNTLFAYQETIQGEDSASSTGMIGKASVR